MNINQKIITDTARKHKLNLVRFRESIQDKMVIYRMTFNQALNSVLEDRGINENQTN